MIAECAERLYINENFSDFFYKTNMEEELVSVTGKEFQIVWLIDSLFLTDWVTVLKVKIDIFTPGSPLCNSTSLSV